jgi:hypothetical protein
LGGRPVALSFDVCATATSLSSVQKNKNKTNIIVLCAIVLAALLAAATVYLLMPAMCVNDYYVLLSTPLSFLISFLSRFFSVQQKRSGRDCKFYCWPERFFFARHCNSAQHGSQGLGSSGILQESFGGSGYVLLGGSGYILLAGPECIIGRTPCTKTLPGHYHQQVPVCG